MSNELMKPVVLGKLGSTYGIRGWLRMFSSTESAESVFDYQPWFIKKAGQLRQIELESWKWHNNELVIKIKGVNDRDIANTFTNCEVLIDEAQLPLLAEDEYYWKDLMGCQVVNDSDYHLGKVIDIMETGSNDVLVVRANSKDSFGKTERLIPFIDEQVIKKVDLATGTITVDWDPDF